MAKKKEKARIAASSVSRPAGRREINKLDKLRRIKEAARELFLSHGFDDTTTREIAVRAEVALGTIFSYAANKRDLLFLVMNDGLEEVGHRAVAAVRPDRSLIQNLLAAFQPLYAFFAEQPVLSRIVLREMFFYEQGIQVARFQATRERMIQLCTDQVVQALERSEISSKEDPKFIGLMIFSIYQVELRRWLTNDKLVVAEGVQTLRRALELLLSGLGPKRSR